MKEPRVIISYLFFRIFCLINSSKLRLKLFVVNFDVVFDLF